MKGYKLLTNHSKLFIYTCTSFTPKNEWKNG